MAEQLGNFGVEMEGPEKQKMAEWENKRGLCPLLRCCRVASATGEVTDGDGSSWEERSTGREQ